MLVCYSWSGAVREKAAMNKTLAILIGTLLGCATPQGLQDNVQDRPTSTTVLMNGAARDDTSTK